MRLWTMGNHRGEPCETADSAVEEMGKFNTGRTSSPRVTSNDSLHRSSTGCGQNKSVPDFPA